MKQIKASLLVALFALFLTNLNAQAPPGAGTSADPYRVSTINHLVWFSGQTTLWNTGKYFIQMNDIDASSVANFTPIGAFANSYTGYYDGKGFSISNLKITSPNIQAGLFGNSAGGYVRNLTLIDPQVKQTSTGGHHVGAIVGYATGPISNCAVIGGFVQNSAQSTGGIVGTSSGTIENCYSTANVTGPAHVGGIAGTFTGPQLRNCYSSGTITATTNIAGGLTGRLAGGGRVINSYSTAHVTGGNIIGGLVGSNSTTIGYVENSYAAGQLTITGTPSTVWKGGISGSSSITQINCLWDINTSGTTTNVGTGSTGKTSAELADINTFLNAGWDFLCETPNGTADLWKIQAIVNGGRPTLYWQGSGYSDNCNVWKGTVSTQWNDAANWSWNAIPASNTPVIISPVAVNDLVLDGNKTVSTLAFNDNGKRVILGNYNLTVSAILNAKQFNLIQTAGTGTVNASIANGASFTFPVGNGGYSPITITNKTGATDIFRVNVSPGVFENGTSGDPVVVNGINRTWNVHKTNPNAGNGIDMRFDWYNSADVMGLFTQPILFHYSTTHAEGARWEKFRANISFTSSSMTISGYQGSFSPFAVMDGTSTLPVTWGKISVDKQQGNSLLKWTTLTEEKAAFYFVQHSVNGSEWKTLAKVAATGNSSAAQHYEYLHTQPANGVNYYRLLQQDIDGRQEYSKVVSLKWNEEKTNMLVYPNPATGGKIQVNVTEAGTLHIFNNTGMLVKQASVKPGTNAVDISLLPKGVYRLKAGDETASLLIK